MMEEESYREPCRRIMRRVFEEKGWLLVREEEEENFLDEIVVEALKRVSEKPGLPPEQIVREAVTNRYCHLWHWACGLEKSVIQDTALRELHRLIYQAVSKIVEDHHLAEDLTQQAMIIIWRKLDQVRDPGSFIEWSKTIARREALRQVTKATNVRNKPGNEIRRTIQFEQDSDDDAFFSQVRETFTRQEPTMRDEIRAELEAAIRTCLRSKMQQEVIIRCILDDKEHKIVAEELGISTARLFVFKVRAIAHLRRCDKFKNTLSDLTLE